MGQTKKNKCPECRKAIGSIDMNLLCYDHRKEIFTGFEDKHYGKRIQPKAVPKKRSKKA